MANRSIAFTTILVFLAVSSPVWARKWADTSGNSMEAKFVRIHNGNVVLQGSNKVVMVPFKDFVPEDQEYIRSELEKKGQAHLIPAIPRSAPTGPRSGGGEAGESGNGGGSPLPSIERIWTDVDGRKIRARFVRKKDDDVVLLMDGKEFTVPLTRFSRVDQSYVRVKSMADQIAKNPGSVPRFPGGMPGMPGGMPEMPRGPSAPRFPGGGGGNMYGGGAGYSSGESEMDYSGEEGYGDESGMDYSEEEGYGDESGMDYSDEGYSEEGYSDESEMDYSGEGYSDEGYSDESEMDYSEEEGYGDESDSYEEESSDHGEEAYASNSYDGSSSRGYSGPGSSGPPYSGGSSGPGYSPPSHAPSFPGSSMPSMPMMEEVGECSNCGEEVSGDYGAGDNCPHCGIYFEYEEDQFGNTTKASGSSGSSSFRPSGSSMRGLFKLVIGIGILVVSACGWVARKMFGS